jgi:hypothetical protein
MPFMVENYFENPKNNWVPNSGGTAYMSFKSVSFKSLKKLSKTRTVILVDSSQVEFMQLALYV